MHFIDNYGLIAPISNTIFRSQVTKTPTITYRRQINRFSDHLSQIKKIIKQKYPQHHINIIQLNQQSSSLMGSSEAIITLLMNDPMSFVYNFYIEISVSLQNQQINLKGNLLRNGIPLLLSSTNKIHMNLSLSFNLNQYISPIRICIHPKLGSIYLQSGAYIQINIKNYDQFYEEISSKIFDIIDQMTKYKFIVLYIIEQSPSHLKSLLEFNKTLVANLQQGDKLIQQLQQSLYCMNLPIYDKKNKLDNALKRRQIIQNYESFNDNINQVLSLYTPKQSHQKKRVSQIQQLSNQKYKDQSIKQCSDILQQRINYNIFTRLCLIDREEWIIWNNLTTGGFGKLEVAQVKVDLLCLEGGNVAKDHLKDNKFLQIKITRKSDKKKVNQSRVLHQKQIINNIKNYAHPNITTFLQLIPSNLKNRQPEEINRYLQNEKYIYSLFQLNTSLDSFLRKNECLSLYSKIFTLQQAAKGLLFLHIHKIVHIDFKPANLFIGKNCLAKVGDFGQSLRLGQQQSYRPASSFPYAPPEYSLNQISLLTEKVDVYSFGVTIFQCLFSSNIKRYMQERYSCIKNSQNSFMELPYLQPELISYFGNKKVMYILAFLCLRCINFDVNCRPSMTWIVTILQYCRRYMQLIQYK